MAALTKTTWSKLEPSLRQELEAVMAANRDTWVSEYHDAMAWWLLLMLASVGGLIGLVVEFGNEATETLSLAAQAPSLIPSLLLQPHWLGLVTCLVIAVWTGVTWARNHNRRGLALTRAAIVVVRGATLKLLPLSELASASSRTIGAVGKRFTVLTLKTKADQTIEFNTRGTWAAAVTRALESTR
ncbi:MAG: hypothetical protein ABTQ32_09000 [Myxococcaceae bacterium]